MTEIDAEPRFQIPADLLRQAKIAEDADIQMIVVDGAILICQEPNLNVQELRKISDSLGLAAGMLQIQEKYGKNAILKGTNLQEGATTIQRNGQIGGHKA